MVSIIRMLILLCQRMAKDYDVPFPQPLRTLEKSPKFHTEQNLHISVARLIAHEVLCTLRQDTPHRSHKNQFPWIP